MARLYLRDTLISGIRRELSETQGVETTLGSGNQSSTSFVEMLRFELEVGADGIDGTSFPCSVDMASVSASTLEWRWRVVKVDSGGNIVTGSAYSSVFNTAGIKTATLTLSTTWAAGDRVGVSLELRKSGGGGNRSFTLNVNDAESYVDASLGGFGEIKRRGDQAAPPPLLVTQGVRLFVLRRLRLGVAALLAPPAVFGPAARLLSAALIRHVRDSSRPSVSHKASSFSYRSLPASTGSLASRIQPVTVAVGPDSVVLSRSYDQGFACSFSAKWAARASTRAAISLGGERNRSRSTQRLREPCEHRQVGVECHPLQAPDAERRESVIVLQASEFALNGDAASVEVAPNLSVAREARSQPPDRVDRQGWLSSDSPKRDNWHALALLALRVDSLAIVSFVHRARLGSEAASAEGIEERRDIEGFVPACRLDAPRERKPRLGAGRHLQLVPVEPPALAGRDGGAVAPGSVRVREALPFWAVLGDEALPVGEGRKVGRVDGHVIAHARKLGMERGGYAVEAIAQEWLVGAELDGEAVAGPYARRAAESRLQARMLGNQGGNPGPGGKGKESFDKASADEGAGTVALAAPRVARRVNLVDQGCYFGRVEQFANVADSRATRYLARCHARCLSCGHGPGSLRCAGPLFSGFAGQILLGRSDVTAPSGRVV